jgi:putative membrane protein
MLFEILIATILGIFFGIISGITPGIHVNLVSVILLSSAPFLLQFINPFTIAVFIVAMAVTHTFLDTLPSIFLGAPDESQVLNVLPGHRLLLQGKGYEAVKITVVGAFLSLVFVVLFIPFSVPFIPLLYNFIQPYIGYILVLILLFMILREKGLKTKLWTIFLFLLSGILGLLVLNMANMKQPLFSLLSGLFGVSTLFLSLNEKVRIPKQNFSDTIVIEKKSQAKSICAAVISGSLAGLLPGLGPAQVAVLAMQFIGNVGEYAFMMLVGGIGTVNFVFSLVALYTIQKARNGAIVVVLEIIKSIDIYQLIALLSVTLIAGGIAAWLTLKIAKVFANYISKINYQKLCIFIIAFIFLLAFLFDNWLGLFILIISTFVGFIAPLANINRSAAMGCLLLPVIMYFIV